MSAARGPLIRSAVHAVATQLPRRNVKEVLHLSRLLYSGRRNAGSLSIHAPACGDTKSSDGDPFYWGIREAERGGMSPTGQVATFFDRKRDRVRHFHGKKRRWRGGR